MRKPASRGLVLNLDPVARAVGLARSVSHPGGTTSITQGSHQVLPESGFETRGEFLRPERYVAVEALDGAGRVLGRSEAVS